MREIFFVHGQTNNVRKAASGKHRTSHDLERRCFMQTCMYNRKHTANEKDPQAPLGMTIRGNAHLTFAFIPLRRRLPLRGSLSSAFGAPLLQGATPLSWKSSASKNNETRIPLYRHFERSEKSSLHTRKTTRVG